MKTSALFKLFCNRCHLLLNLLFLFLVFAVFHSSLASAGPSSCVDGKLKNAYDGSMDRPIADGMKNGNSSAFRLAGDREARARGAAAARPYYATALTKFESEVGTDVMRMNSREASDYAAYLVKSKDPAQLSPATIEKAAQAIKREADELAAVTYGVSSYDLSRYDATSYLAKRGLNRNDLISAAQWSKDLMTSNLKTLSALYPEAAAGIRRALGL